MVHLAILEAVRVWRPYLLGQKFIIRTDHCSLKYFLEQKVATPEQQKWVTKLMGYDYEIQYRPGKENKAADSLSRVSGSPLLQAISIPCVGLWDDIRKASKGHPYMERIMQLAKINPGAPYTLRDGLVYYKGMVVVPPQTPIIGQLITEFHNSGM